MRLILLAILSLATTNAYPYGSGSCNSVNPLGDVHLAGGIVTSGLVSAAGLQLAIDGKVVDPKVPFSFATGKDLNITLGSTTGATFRGFLMRIGTSTNEDTTGFLKVGTDTNVQVLGLCTSIKIGGLSHVNKVKKSKVNGIL